VLDLERDDASAEFFDGCARGVLVIKQCDACGHFLRPDATVCSVCHTPGPSWADASGTGTLVSWIVVHRSPEAAPNLVGLVELDEGPWLHARLDGVDPLTLAVGTALRVDFEDAGTERVPVFRSR
jgi:uncharacterized OB-fold protein